MSNENRTGTANFEFSDEQRVSWLRLYRSQNVGPKTFRELITYFGTAAAALDALPSIAQRGGAKARIKIPARNKIEREIIAAEKFGAKYVAMGEREFPALLRQIDTAPPVLCCMGNTNLFRKSSLAIVGSRNASVAGMRLTQHLASEMGAKDFVIVSGLARGIDTAAHKASIETGTIAVFAGGINNVYPKENHALASKIVENDGLVVTEMPFDHEPIGKDFPRRNRIVAGLAEGVLVVEAAMRSGSLITARLATETGRSVMAIPGSPLDPRSAGTNNLIRDGATLVTGSDDIVEALTPLALQQNEFVYDISEDADRPPEQPDGWDIDVSDNATNLRTKIGNAVGMAPVEVDEIIRFCGKSPGEVQLILLEFALAGRLEHHPGNKVSLIQPEF